MSCKEYMLELSPACNRAPLYLKLFECPCHPFLPSSSVLFFPSQQLLNEPEILNIHPLFEGIYSSDLVLLLLRDLSNDLI